MAKKEVYDALQIVHPGFIIKMELKARGIKQKDFAKDIAIQPSHLSEILKGNRNVSNQLAEKIESVLGIPSAHLKQLQAEYDFKLKTAQINDIAEHEAEKMIQEYNVLYDMRVIFKYLGMTDMRSTEKVKFCCDSLHFVDTKQQMQYVYGRYHRSDKTGLDLRMISTWSILARYEAMRQPTPEGQYLHEKLDVLSTELSEIFNDNRNTINRVTRKLSEYGIKFCIVPKVDRASIDGFSFISESQPAIVVTKRYNRIDNLAFAVLHEVGHLKMHLSDNQERVTIAEAEEMNTKEEREANEYAANALIPNSTWAKAPEVSLNPHAIQVKYSAWAKKEHLNKWIVLGRVSHDTGMYMFKSDSSREIQ